MKYSIDEMKYAFDVGRNYQLTGENNFREMIEELDGIKPKVIIGEAINNKLTPIKNLIAMLENGLVTGEVAMHDLVFKELEGCKESINYLKSINTTFNTIESYLTSVSNSITELENSFMPSLIKELILEEAKLFEKRITNLIRLYKQHETTKD